MANSGRSSASSDERKLVMLSVRLDRSVHEKLRRIAFERRVSIHSLLIEGVDTVCKKYVGKNGD